MQKFASIVLQVIETKPCSSNLSVDAFSVFDHVNICTIEYKNEWYIQ